MKDWSRAVSIDDLGELTAGWLEGSVPTTPTYGGSPDPETLPLVPVLAAMNRAGFWTDHSQPGERQADGYAQRAHVSGFCSESASNAIVAGSLATDLIALAMPAVFESHFQIPISRVGGREWTWAGVHVPLTPEDLGEAATAFDAVLDSWHVEVIDPAWGRNDLLWPTVLKALVERPERVLVDHGQFDGPPPPGCRTASERP